MATATTDKPATGKPSQELAERLIEYVPFGEREPIKLSVAIVGKQLAVPTRRGVWPTESELVRFMMLCKARELNPWVGDAYLVGYDSEEGAKFSLITAIQALLKRAEANPSFDGMESGVVVIRANEIIERPGNLVFPGEQLYGGWAKLWRKDRSRVFYDALPLSVYNTGRSQWKKDPAGMIDKCAQASVLRMAFPSQLGSLYIEQERAVIEGHGQYNEPVERVSAISGLTERMAAARGSGDQTAQAPPSPSEPTSDAEATQVPPTTPTPSAEPASQPADSLAAVKAEFSVAAKKNGAAIERVYDSLVGPNSSAQWSDAEVREIERLREEAHAALKGAKARKPEQGSLLDKGGANAVAEGL